MTTIQEAVERDYLKYLQQKYRKPKEKKDVAMDVSSDMVVEVPSEPEAPKPKKRGRKPKVCEEKLPACYPS